MRLIDSVNPGVFAIAKEICPELELHISTQANNTNYGTYLFWYAQGAKRVVSARELSLAEIREIRANIPDDLEIETFIHGANVYVLFGTLSVVELFYRKGREPRRMYAPVPLEICAGGGEASGRVSAGL